MCKWALLVALLLGMTSLISAEGAQGGQDKGEGKGPQCGKQDGNGECVRLQLRLRDGSCGEGCAKCEGCGKNFLDSDGDGLCDNEGCKGGKGQCQRQCQQQRNGQGNGNGNGACVRNRSQDGQGQGQGEGQGQGQGQGKRGGRNR